MTGGEKVALGLGGVVVIGGAAYLLLRKPAPVTATKNGLGQTVAPGAVPTVGQSINSLLNGVGFGLVNLFAGSKSPSQQTTVSAFTNTPIAPAAVPPAQNIANLQAQGWTGLDAPTASEQSLGITEADYG